MQKLLVSVRGKTEALSAVKGGAKIADVEYPVSALGTPYPLNVSAVRNTLNRNGFEKLKVSTNIGENQNIRANSVQAALGVAVAGADLIKFGMAEQTLKSASYLGKSIVRTVHRFAKGKKLYPAVFVDDEMQRYFNPFEESVELATEINADGILIDTYNKLIGNGLLDYCTLNQVEGFANSLHAAKKEAWVAGSITIEELPELWATGVDVICVRGAACTNDKGAGRFGKVSQKIVEKLVATIPKKR